MTSQLRREAARHPFIAGVAILVLGPYILAFLLLLAVLCMVAFCLDLVVTRK